LLHRPLEPPTPVAQLDAQEHAEQLVTEEAQGDSHAKNPDWQEEAQVKVLAGSDDQRERGTRQGRHERQQLAPEVGNGAVGPTNLLVERPQCGGACLTKH